MIANYDGDVGKTTATVEYIGCDAFTSPTATFYWIAELRNFPVSVTATLNGTSLSASTTYKNVYAPGVSMTVTPCTGGTNGFSVVPDPGLDANTYKVHFGTIEANGMDFSASVVGGDDWQYGWTQVVTVTGWYVNEDDVRRDVPWNTGVDGDFRYNPDGTTQSHTVDLRSGTKATDYHILVRDAAGKAVPLRPGAEAWFNSHHFPWTRPLRPAEAVGFVFPLQELFDVEEGKEYRVLITLSDASDGGRALGVGPVKVRIPDRQIPGGTRPFYGSSMMWERLVVLASRSQQRLALRTEIAFKGKYAELMRDPKEERPYNECPPDVSLRLFNRSSEPVQFPVDRGYSAIKSNRIVVLLRDEAGDFVPPNENVRTAETDWTAQPLLVKLPPGESTPQVWRYPLGTVFSLRPGERYTLLAAVNLPEVVGGVIVSEPLTFIAPTTDTVDDTATSRPRASSVGSQFQHAPAELNASNGDHWQGLERFAALPFGGLSLSAIPAMKHASGAEIDVTVHNRSDHAVLMKKWTGESDYKILIRDAQGKNVPLSEKGKQFFNRGTLLEIRELKPQEEITAPLALSDLFAFPGPGEYTVLASLPVIGDVDAVLTAAPVKVRIDAAGMKANSGAN